MDDLTATSTLLAPLLVASLLLGCETAQVIDFSLIAKQEGFIADGKTRKKEVLDRFGPAQSSYENGALFVYHVHLDERGSINLRRDKRVRCDAYVLVFDEHDVLERHSLVKNGCH